MLDVSSAVVALDDEDLLQLGPDVLAEALRGQPGVFFQQTTPGQGMPIIRGLKGSQVLHLVDGMRLNNAFFRSAPNQYLALVDSFSAARIEVVRGAAGSLYGADAMGGVVQIITAEPAFTGDKLQAEGRVYTAWDSVDSGFTVRGDAAMGNERVTFKGGASYQNFSDRTVGGGETIAPSGWTSRAADVKLIARLGEGSELMLSAAAFEQPSTPRVDELVPGFGQTEPSSEQFLFEPNKRDFLHARLRLQGPLSWIESMEFHLARQEITDDRRTQDFRSPLINTEQNKSTLDGLTFSAVSKSLQGWSLAWGAELYFDEVGSARQRFSGESTAPIVVQSRFPDGSSMDSRALYATLTWPLSDRLTVDAGLRYSDFDIELTATPGSPGAKLSPDDFTGDLRAVFALNDTVSLVTNLGRGFRPPNIFDLGTLGPRPGNRFNIANPDLGPETVWSYDIGIKAIYSGWQFEAFAWAMDYQDKITSVLTGESTPEGRDIVRSENRNSVALYGLEANLSWTVNDSWSGFASLNFTRGEEDDGSEMFPADRIPPLSGRLGASWNINERWSLEPYLLFAAEQDRLSPRDVRDPRIAPQGTGGWTTLSINTRWQLTDQLTAGLRLENLLDENYREHGSGIDGPGRNFGLWFNATF
jgi:outer membrane receptor protein involved in Fe transport